jgi:pimeloyl-ACP methyl ester carboxylesterase
MKWLALLVAAIVLAACGGKGSGAATPLPSGLPEGTIAATDPPAIQDGHKKAVMADGTVIAYSLVLPQNFDHAESYPVLLALPPGGQDQEVVDNVIERVWKAEAKNRGWLVISPVAPGALFYEPASAKYLPELVAQITRIYPPEGGMVHLAGVSNGGLSAFRAALDHPELFLDLLTFPGYPPEQSDDVARLKRVPVAIWVGELDSGWRENAAAAVEKLKAAGGSAQITVVPGESHILESVGGKEYFDFLDRQRPGP